MLENKKLLLRTVYTVMLAENKMQIFPQNIFFSREGASEETTKNVMVYRETIYQRGVATLCIS